MDLSDSEGAPRTEQGLVDNDRSDAFDSDALSSSDEGSSAAEAEADDGAVSTGAPSAMAARACLDPVNHSAMLLLLGDPTAQDTIRSVYQRLGRASDAEKVHPDVERDLTYALRTEKEHILRILVAPPANTEGGMPQALAARAKNSRDLRRAMEYIDAFVLPTCGRLLAYAASRSGSKKKKEKSEGEA
jgi:hypothetical protein